MLVLGFFRGFLVFFNLGIFWGLDFFDDFWGLFGVQFSFWGILGGV